LSAFWNNVEVVATSDTQLQFKLPEPFSPFLDYLSFGILPKHLLENIGFDDLVDASFNLQPVGSGPYQFERLIAEDGKITGVVLAANDRYYGSQPFIQQIIFRYYDNGTSALEAYRNGDVQVSGIVSRCAYRSAEGARSIYLYCATTEIDDGAV
jgi:peptide/nickel transport system substrate-binding protein